MSEVFAPEGIVCRQYMLGMQNVFGRSGNPKDLLDTMSCMLSISQIKLRKFQKSNIYYNKSPDNRVTCLMFIKFFLEIYAI